MNKAFVTGIDGFTGRYMALELARAGYEVHGLVRTTPVFPLDEVHTYHVGELGSRENLLDVISTVSPKVVVHLAAVAFVGHANVRDIYESNVIGTRNLLDALQSSGIALDSVLLASSANVYGNSVEGILTETTPFAPANDYAVSKIAMEYVARIYEKKLPIIVVRPFNYTGVGQSIHFLVPKIVYHVRKRKKSIELGNLQISRDFSDVRTVVAYYAKLLGNSSAIGKTFNVCSGAAYSLSEIISFCKSISHIDFEVIVNPQFVRENEVKVLTGDCSKLIRQVGPVEKFSFDETLEWMIKSDHVWAN